MKLRFTRRAVDNIAELADYIRARNPEAAEAVRTAIYDSLANLLLFPNVGANRQPKVFVSS
jgi:plasmid stabilization system protein ParE